MKFNLIRPCENCPFRSDKLFPLHSERAKEIAKHLLENDGSFSCHKTIDYGHYDEFEETPDSLRDLDNESFCAGALIILAKEGSPNRIPRIAAFFEEFEPSKLDMDSSVYDSFAAFIQAMSSDSDLNNERTDHDK